LVVFSGEQRIKEIGIRKVLGANVAQVVVLLSRDFLKLVILSVVVASPVAYYLVNVWLRGFEYRIDIHWSIFVLAAFGAVVVALLTISFQAVKSALVNPVESLRSE
jgi:putative ABC transport system permease protein